MYWFWLAYIALCRRKFLRHWRTRRLAWLLSLKWRTVPWKCIPVPVRAKNQRGGTDGRGRGTLFLRIFDWSLRFFEWKHRAIIGRYTFARIASRINDTNVYMIVTTTLKTKKTTKKASHAMVDYFTGWTPPFLTRQHQRPSRLLAGWASPSISSTLLQARKTTQTDTSQTMKHTSRRPCMLSGLVGQLNNGEL